MKILKLVQENRTMIKNKVNCIFMWRMGTFQPINGHKSYLVRPGYIDSLSVPPKPIKI